jgi:hypothetical protein
MSKKTKDLICLDDSGAKNEFYALSKGGWIELRRTQGEDKGKPYTVSDSLQVNIRFSKEDVGKQLRVYIEKVEDDN